METKKIKSNFLYVDQKDKAIIYDKILERIHLIESRLKFELPDNTLILIENDLMTRTKPKIMCRIIFHEDGLDIPKPDEYGIKIITKSYLKISLEKCR